MNRQNAFLTALLVCALILWSYFDRQDEIDDSILPVAYVPNFTASNLYSIAYTESGEVSYRIYADSMEYYDQLKLTSFENPQVLVYPGQDKPIWQIDSQQAIVNDNGHVILQEDVLVQNMSRTDYVKSISTQVLHLNLEEQSMTTDKQVDIEGVEYFITGIGMHGNMAKETITLLKQIKANYYNEQN